MAYTSPAEFQLLINNKQNVMMCYNVNHVCKSMLILDVLYMCSAFGEGYGQALCQ